MPVRRYPTLHNYVEANRRTTPEYDDVALELLEGALPPSLVGTLLRNGNGHFEQHGVLYDHLFDGDGMVARFVFDGQTVRYRNRYVRTDEFVAEERAGRMLYRSFGTNLPGGLRANFLKTQFKNTANTSLVQHGGQLLALWEGGLPHALDPATLATRGRFDYGGVLRNPFSWLDRRITPELPFSAHPKVHPTTGVLHNFGTVAGTQHRLVLYEVSPAGEARLAHALPMPEATFAHDFVLTESGHQIFFLTPVAFDVLRAFAGLTSPAASIKVNPAQPTQIIVVGPDGTVHRLHTDFGFTFHFVNGYQDTDGTLVADALLLGNYPDSASMKAYLSGHLPDDQPQARFVRFRLDLAAGTVTRQSLADCEGELPEIHPDRVGRPYRYAWTIGRPSGHPLPLLDHLIKLDVQTGEVRHAYAPDTLCSEPVVVPRRAPNGAPKPAEDDGYLVYLRYSAPDDATDLIVADAADLRLLARLRLPHNIPLGFHGMWLK
ncbi:carotenoid oxygenase family protein [Hymenobacter coccineus]|uniref:Lignostilbene alpha-beta-dioxygenase n=1 Tax=Hymenobacter coccineus TaxID=1908235 RepID=A0A1G1SZX3_9BACT|nr:carotenoid oxygenase family protein [Hymenobacter coccineus]OGX84156.1 lignostilbene alpha-beta-dioxygenase [Hymenobacter coccineus]